MSQITFQQYLNKTGGTLAWADAVRLFLRVCEKIENVTSAQNAYVDVAPSQILLDEATGDILSCGAVHPLADWDCSDCADPTVLPWEFCNAYSRRTAAAQVYPLAACLYLAVRGEFPPTGEERICGADLPSPIAADVPAVLETVIQKGLALNVGERYASVSDFAAALTALVADGAAVARSTSDVAPIDLSAIRSVPKSGAEDVYCPAPKKKNTHMGPLLPMAVMAIAFAAGLAFYKSTMGSVSVVDVYAASSVFAAQAAESAFRAQSASSAKAASEAAASASESASASDETASSVSSEVAASTSVASSVVASSSAPTASSASSKPTASSKVASSAATPAASSVASSAASSTASSAASTEVASSSAIQTITMEDGSTFVGTVNGSTGTGTLTTKSGDVYKGTFQDGKLNGNGTLTNAKGDVYTGNFVDGKRSGSGTVKYANGDTFTGTWANDLKDGSGTYKWANGSTYTGRWSAGKVQKGGTYNYSEEGAQAFMTGNPLQMQE